MSGDLEESAGLERTLLLDDATAGSSASTSGPRSPPPRHGTTVPLRSIGGGARMVFEASARGRAAAEDYRRREERAALNRPAPYNPPWLARLCDELLFGVQIERHRARLAGYAVYANESPGPRCIQPSFWLLVPTCLMGTVAQTALTPILPQLKQQFFGSGHEAATISGWTDSAGFCIGFLVAGIIGKLSDCYGRRAVIIAQKLSSLLCLAALAFRAQLHNNLWVYIGMSVAQNAVTGGRFGGSTVWNAYLADCYETHERSLYFGYYTGLWMAAITVGPLIPVYVPQLAGVALWDTNFKFAFALGCADLLYCTFILPESLPESGRPTFSLEALNPFAPLRYLSQSKLVRCLAIVLVPNTLQGAGMGDYLFYYLQTYLGYGTMQNAWQAAWWGITGVVVNWFFLKPLLRWFGEQPLVCLGLCTALMSQIMYIVFTNHFIIMVVQNWVSGFNVLLGVCVSGLISKFAKGDEQGFALGTLAAVQSIVSVLGPAVFGGLYGWAAPKGGVIIGPHLAFMVAAVLTILSLIAAVVFLFPVVSEYERKQKEQDALGSKTREANPAVESYKQNYLRGGDYRRGGTGDY